MVTQNTLCKCERKQVFIKNSFRFSTAVDLNGLKRSITMVMKNLHLFIRNIFCPIKTEQMSVILTLSRIWWSCWEERGTLQTEPTAQLLELYAYNIMCVILMIFRFRIILYRLSDLWDIVWFCKICIVWIDIWTIFEHVFWECTNQCTFNVLNWY